MNPAIAALACALVMFDSFYVEVLLTSVGSLQDQAYVFAQAGFHWLGLSGWQPDKDHS